MCTMIAAKLPLEGSGKGPAGWFPIDHAYIAYDHTFHVQLEHALTLDFVNEARGPGARGELLRGCSVDGAMEPLFEVLGVLQSGLLRGARTSVCGGGGNGNGQTPTRLRAAGRTPSGGAGPDILHGCRRRPSASAPGP